MLHHWLQGSAEERVCVKIVPVKSMFSGKCNNFMHYLMLSNQFIIILEGIEHLWYRDASYNEMLRIINTVLSYYYHINMII